MQTSYRPMTRREKAELRALVSPTTTAVRASLFIAALVLVGWIGRGSQALLEEATGASFPFPLWLLPTGLVGGVIYVQSRRWTGGPQLRRRLRRDLERGEVVQHRVRVIRALEAPEIEDEGPVFFVQEADGAILFFGGQEMARYKSRGFPWREFEIEESTESHRFFRLRALADSFTNVELRDPLTWTEAKDLGVMSAAYGFLERTFDELRTGA